ncbi:MAG: hypothetical protein RSB57_03950 [Hungatella sp.]
MKRLRRQLTLWMAVLLLAGLVSTPVQASLEDTSSNEVVISSSIPKGKIGKSMTLSFVVKNNTASDWEDATAGIAEGTDYLGSDKLEGSLIFPFEVTTSAFKPRLLGTIKAGSSRSVSVSAKVRGDLTEGYYAVRIDVSDKNGTVASEFVNIWVYKGTGTDAEDKKKAVSFVLGEGQSTPYGVYPNVMDYSINLRNSSLVDARDVTVSMVLSKDSAEFPFDINEGNYDRTFEKIAAGDTVTMPYSMAIRSDVYSGFFPIKFNVTYRDTADGELKTEEKSLYVKVKNKEKEDPLGEFNENNRTKARLIVDSYKTIPATIIAGEEFELVVTMKNASATIPASNILLSLVSEKASDSAVFSTEAGSSAIVVNSLGAGQTTEFRVKMTSKAGIAQRSYALTIKEKYDSPEFKNAAEEVVIDIPVKQIARLNTGTVEVMPASISVGGESNVMFPINNTGKVMLYNVMVLFEADSIRKTDTYIGNIEPGKSGNVDIMLSGMAATADEGKVKMSITYEDENGTLQAPVEKEMSLFVTEEMPIDVDMEGDLKDASAEPVPFFQKYKMLIFPAAIAVVAAAVVIIRKKKKKAAEEEGMDDEIS